MILPGLLLLSPTARSGAVAVPASAGVEEAFAPRRIALVVGLNDYPGSAGLPDLRYAEDDARSLGALLDEQVHGDFDEVRVLTAPLTREAFWAAFEQVTAGIQSDDTLLVYFSGHGTLTDEDRPEEVLLMTDGRLDAPADTGVRITELTARISATTARRRVLIIDACRNLNPAYAGLKGAAPVAWRAPLSEADVQLFATAPGHPAQENSELEGGVYTTYLLEAFETPAADTNQDGLLEIVEAHDWATLRTQEYTGFQQKPDLNQSRTGHIAIYLSGDHTTRREHEAEGLIIAAEGDTGTRGGATLSRMVTAGALWRTEQFSGDLFTPLALSLSAYRLTPRLMLGLEGTSTVGTRPLGAQARITTGTAAATVSVVWGSRLRVGPALGVGLMWKLNDPDITQPFLSVEQQRLQSAPMLSLGAVAALRLTRAAHILATPSVAVIGPTENLEFVWTVQSPISVGFAF